MKYLKVSVSRAVYTDLFIEVPDDFNIDKIHKSEYRNMIDGIAESTTSDFDWDDSDKSTEISKVEVATKEEASQYEMGRLE